MVYRLKMYDSGDDGWQSAVHALRPVVNLEDGEPCPGFEHGADDLTLAPSVMPTGVVTSGTLSSGSEGFDWLCLADGCYELTVGGGSAESEIRFEFVDEVRILN